MVGTETSARCICNKGSTVVLEASAALWQIVSLRPVLVMQRSGIPLFPKIMFRQAGLDRFQMQTH